MRRTVFVPLVAVGLAFVVGCNGDETPQTAEEAQKLAAEKLDAIKQYVKDQDVEKAEDVLDELKRMLEDAPDEAKAAIQKAIDTAEGIIRGAKAAEEGGDILDKLPGGGD